MSKEKAFLLIILACDWIWLRSSWGKIIGGKFVGGMSQTLTKFASNNPYPWVKSFLENIAMPNSNLFGTLTMWGEALVGVSLLLSSAFLLLGRQRHLARFVLATGLFGGAFLNGVFYLASGWTSASTDGLNLLMFLIQLIAFIAVIKE